MKSALLSCAVTFRLLSGFSEIKPFYIIKTEACNGVSVFQSRGLLFQKTATGSLVRVCELLKAFSWLQKKQKHRGS
jgi:hypothetical protein